MELQAFSFNFGSFQKMAREWTKLKLELSIIVLLMFSFVVQVITNLNIICSSIGISTIAILTIYNQSDFNLPIFALAFIVTFDLPWISIQGTLPICWFMAKIWKELDWIGKIIYSLIWLQVQLILMRYQEVIIIPWGTILILFFLPLIFGIFMFVQVGRLYFRGQKFRSNLAIFEEQLNDAEILQQVHTDHLHTVVWMGVWLSFLSVFIQCYLPDYISRVMIALSFSIELIQLAMFFLFKKQICHHCWVDFYSSSVVLRKHFNRFQNQQLHGRKRVSVSMSELVCYECEQPANVVDIANDNAGDSLHLAFCLQCAYFSPLFKEFKRNRAWYLVTHDFPFLSISYRHFVKSFLYPQDYFFSRARL